MVTMAMNSFDKEASIARLADEICRGIHSRRKRREAAREYTEHIEDSIYHYTLSGMTEEQAFYKACEALGSAELCRELLQGVHNSKNPAADIDLPYDIRHYVRKNIIKRIILCVLIVALDIVAYFICNQYFTDNLGFVNMIAIFVAAGFCGISATGIFKYVFDRSWCGEVINVKVETVYNATSFGSSRGCARYEENVIWLYIKKPNGKIIIHDAIRLAIAMDTPYRRLQAHIDKYVNVGKIENEIKNYSVGDKVYHFYGVPHLFVHHIEDMSRVSCIVCGMKNPAANKVCGECGHTLITQEIIE
jgi:hypothetical protein